ncbi:MAG: hypothetical protein VXW22_12205, partial [Pseudomonadota bacterium]|nr:hypothetical protein [Pseudomonadota bacterium]
MPDDLKSTADAAAILKQQLGEQGLKDDQASREFMSQDIWAKGETADFVAAPTNVAEMQTAIRAAYERGLSLNP